MVREEAEEADNAFHRCDSAETQQEYRARVHNGTPSVVGREADIRMIPRRSSSMSPRRETATASGTFSRRNQEGRPSGLRCSGGIADAFGNGQLRDVDGYSSSTNNKPVRLVVTQEDVESVATVWGRITALRGDHNRAKKVVSLDAHVRAVMRTSKERLSTLREVPLQDAEVLTAKYDLYEVCFRELISITDAISPSLSGVLEILRGAYSSIFQEVPEIVRRAIHKNVGEVSHLQEKADRSARESAELVKAARALEMEATEYSHEIRVLRRKQERLEREKTSLRRRHGGRASIRKTWTQKILKGPAHEAGSFMGHDAKKSHLLAERSTTTASCDGEREEGMTRDPSLFEGDAAAGGACEDEGTAAEEATVTDAARGLSLRQLKDLIFAIYSSKEKYDKRCDLKTMPKRTLSEHLDAFLLHRYGLTSMARTQAEAIQKGVHKYREEDNAVRVFELILRNEVVEGFYREQQNIKQAVVAFLRSGIEKRAAHCGTISVCLGGHPGQQCSKRFGKGASHAVVDFLLRNQTRPEAPLSATDWSAVVCHICNGNTADAQTIGVLIKKAISAHRLKSRSANGKHQGVDKKEDWSWNNNRVPFGVLLQVLLEYHLHRHLRSRRHFREDFRKSSNASNESRVRSSVQVDIDADGVLDPAQFMMLAKRALVHADRVASTSPCHPSIVHDPSWARTRETREHRGRDTRQRKSIIELAAELLKVADPHDFGRITFSECARCLASVIRAGCADG